MLQNLRVIDVLGSIPFAFVLSQEKGFLWKDLSQKSFPTQPVTPFSMKEVVHRYLPDLEENTRAFESTLELLVLGWLIGLTAVDADIQGEPETTLKQAGFIDAIEDALANVQPSI